MDDMDEKAQLIALTIMLMSFSLACMIFPMGIPQTVGDDTNIPDQEMQQSIIGSADKMPQPESK